MPPEFSEIIDISSDDEHPAPARCALNPQQGGNNSKRSRDRSTALINANGVTRAASIGNSRKNATTANTPLLHSHQSSSAMSNAGSSSRSRKRPRKDSDPASMSAKNPRVETAHTETSKEIQHSKVIDLTASPEPENKEPRGQDHKLSRMVPEIETSHESGSGRAHATGTLTSPGDDKGAVRPESSADHFRTRPPRETSIRATVVRGRSRNGAERHPTSEIPESPQLSPVVSVPSPGRGGPSRSKSPSSSSEQRVVEVSPVKDHINARKDVPQNKNTTKTSSPQDVASDDRRGQEPGTLPEQAAYSNQDSSIPIASTSSALKSAMPDVAQIATSRQMELVVGQYLEEMRRDNEHWTRIELRRARHSTGSSPSSTKGMMPTSVFKSLGPIQLDVAAEKRPVQPNTVKICVEQFLNAPRRTSKTSYALIFTRFRTKSADIPAYSHYVSIKNSFLAHNETRMQHKPYFNDDFDIEASGLYKRFYNDTNNRELKLLRLGQAERFAAYAQDMLTEVGCDWTDLLRFFLDASPDVGASPDARKALETRETYCKEDFVRDGMRWTSVLSKLPAPNSSSVGNAALLCDQFHSLAKFSLWHVVRREDFTRRLLREIEDYPIEGDLTCRVCMRLNCPYHGQMKEILKDDNEDNQLRQDKRDILETDIINPKQVNFRARVSLPPTMEGTISSAAKLTDRRHLDYWHKGQMSNLISVPTERNPFYPCHHPGRSCENARCTCFNENIMCEKSCGCAPACPRKFQGCSCSFEKPRKGQKLICFEDARCVCFAMGRECDPDLCGACGVCDVLDPLHKHCEIPGRCWNAGIQRGVGKQLIIGDSGIHGLGLYACEDICAHDFVGEYKGEIVNEEEAERRGAVYEHQNLSYLFRLNKSQDIDGTFFGNKMRFINHALASKCNLYPRIRMVNSVFRIALYGRREIRAGEELFFDYGPDFFLDDQLASTTEKRAAPHVRNSGLVSEFLDMEEVQDLDGNVRARKIASNPSKDDVARTTARGRSRQVGKKSRRRGSLHIDSNSRPLRDEQDKDMDAGATEWEDAGTRLESYKISDGGDGDTRVEWGDKTYHCDDSSSTSDE